MHARTLKTPNTLLLSLVLAVGCGAVGCGGGAEPASDTAADETQQADTSGDEVVQDEEPEPDPEPPPTTGPAQLTVTNSVGNEPGGGTVQVLDERGEVVAEGSSGQTFNVTSGTYRLRGSITEASVLIDTPTHELDGYVTVPAGETTSAQINFPVAHVLLRVRRGGRDVASWQLDVSREGRQGGGGSIRLTPSSEHVPITPGRYSGVLRQGGQQIEVSGLIFQGGARMTVPVNVN